jgi:PAS domain-containing protein
MLLGFSPMLGASTLEAKETKHKRTEELLRKNEEGLGLVIKGSDDGLWHRDVRTGGVCWSPQSKELPGYPDHDNESSFEQRESLLHPDDRKRVLKALRKHCDRPMMYSLEKHLTKCYDLCYNNSQTIQTGMVYHRRDVRR